MRRRAARAKPKKLIPNMIRWKYLRLLLVKERKLKKKIARARRLLKRVKEESRILD